MAEIKEIPEPPALPFFGHAFGYIDSQFPIRSMEALAETYGEIYRLRRIGTPVTFCSHYKLISELCDEKRFRKVPQGLFKELRGAANDGLITAYLDEENWGIAHRVLMPALGPNSIRGMFDEMHDIASQLAMKWARMGKTDAFSPNEDFTRLAMDTLALCSMDYRFNSFYNPETHPFLQAMGRTLLTARQRVRRGDNTVAAVYYRQQYQQYAEDIAYLRQLADEVVAFRGEHPSDRKDLVAAMLDGVDPKTGKKMTEKSITDNALSFLVAGHETTATLLAFVLFHLIKNPRVLNKAQKEVDDVIGTGTITVDHLSKLPYMNAIFREVLRLEPPLPVFAVVPYEDTLLGGKYLIRGGENCVLLLKKAQRDPEIYGEDADIFRPERMLDEHFNQLPPGAWKPFGNGQRSCIGRAFAMQEATLMLAMLLQNFNISFDDPDYEINYEQTLTLRPKDLRVRAQLRDGLTATSLQYRLLGGKTVSPAANGKAAHDAAADLANASSTPLTILYGSNSGTCEALAQKLATNAPSQGFYPVSLERLDSAVENLPKDRPVVIIATSYEGEPTDDAKLFVSWLQNETAAGSLAGVKYAVYGLGHHEWVSTFHRIPKLIDAQLEQAGAERLTPLALVDVADTEVFSSFEAWEDGSFWSALKSKYGQQSEGGSVTTGVKHHSYSRPIAPSHLAEATVVESRILTSAGEAVKRHVELELPHGTSYRAGDYLLVHPENSTEIVSRALERFGLSSEDRIPLAEVRPSKSDEEKDGEAATYHEILRYDVELSQPATKRNILSLIEAVQDAEVKARLEALSSELYDTEILAKYTSVLDLLEEFPSIDISMTAFLNMLPPIRGRQYSISSSPLWNPNRATLTFSLIDQPSLSRQGRRHKGVATSHLASLAPGDKLKVAVRASHAAFHLPADAADTPLLMVAAGSGIAPFRGFIQERAARIQAGQAALPPAVLFYGCREPGRDDLYAAELSAWEELGAVKVQRAYSRAPERAGGNKYVQDALWAERAEVNRLWDSGAKLFICGSRKLGEGVRRTMVAIHLERAEGQGEESSEQTISEWWETLRNTRYSIDLFD